MNFHSHIRDLDLSGITLIQRTGAGTQGAVRSRAADVMLAASFVVAAATIQNVLETQASEITFVISGRFDGRGDEDLACAQYLETLLRGQRPDPEPFIRRVYESRDALQHLDPAETGFPHSDLDCCMRIDHFDFAMPVTRENGRLVMRAAKPT